MRVVGCQRSSQGHRKSKQPMTNQTVFQFWLTVSVMWSITRQTATLSLLLFEYYENRVTEFQKWRLKLLTCHTGGKRRLMITATKRQPDDRLNSKPSQQAQAAAGRWKIPCQKIWLQHPQGLASRSKHVTTTTQTETEPCAKHNKTACDNLWDTTFYNQNHNFISFAGGLMTTGRLITETKTTGAQSISDCVPAELPNILIWRPIITPGQSISERGQSIKTRPGRVKGMHSWQIEGSWPVGPVGHSVSSESGTFTVPSSCHGHSSSSFTAQSGFLILWESTTASW